MSTTAIQIEQTASVSGRSASFQDGFRTTGTSPTTGVSRRPRYDTVHLLGAGPVGRAFLERVAASPRTLVAVTDSTATVCDPSGLDARAIADWKAAGRPLREFAGARSLTVRQAIARADADIVVDASSTELERAGWTVALSEALTRNVCLALAAKAALCEAGAEWFAEGFETRVGCNAVLGGTGLQFSNDVAELRRRCRGVAIVGNASTTTILEAIERGASLEEGIAEAARLGYLESDPELDLRGADAAVKLAIVAGVLTGRRILPDQIPCEDIRNIDVQGVRARPRRGATTRLVARLRHDGSLCVAYEEVARDSVLAARCGQVVYDYQLTGNERKLHVGGGLGPAATADALWSDVQALIARHPTRRVAGGAR